ncbi:MAG: type III pantothenate kinase [Acidobacteriota bacterium]
MLLTIDVGNTTTGAAIFSGEKIISKNKLLTPPEITVLFLKSLVKEDCRGAIKAVSVSSVVPFVDESLKRSVNELFGVEPYFTDYKTETGIRLKIDKPEEMGADRIADYIGALSIFPPPFIVVDSGTATTFDIISREKEYIGGSIFPGIELSIKSLAQNTAKLGMIKFGIPESIIGTNTENSIKAGIYFNYIGGLSYMIREYKKLIGPDAKVIATGGLTKYFEGKIPDIDLYEPDLIYLGLKKIYEDIKSK